MKAVDLILMFLILFLILVISCQHELHFTNRPSVGYLGKDLGGNCLPARPVGTFAEGTNLDQSNYLEVELEVTQPGNYTVSTNTVNGYSFKASGNFASTGSQTVQLIATGKPTAAGLNTFEIRYDTSRCNTSVFVQSAVGPSAVYTLVGTPDKCLDSKTFGRLVKNIDLDTSNKAEISVNITSPGNFSITTNTVNGHYFFRIGTFTSTGPQKVILMGVGRPQDAGETKFLIGGGLTSCNFSDTVYSN